MEKNRQTSSPPTEINAGRRQLTKAGLAVPAVLGLLTSRSVLADVPWKCTVSGQVSGNLSGHGSETCDSLGETESYWQTTYPLSANPKTKIKFVTSYVDKSLIYIDDLGNLTTVKNESEATVNEILNIDAASNDVIRYAQKALVLLLNAQGRRDISSYPLTEAQAAKLYLAAVKQLNYTDTNPAVNWPYSHVVSYIDVLLP